MAPGFEQKSLASIARMTTKFISCILLLALVFVVTGCTTTALVNRAKGYTGEQVQPLKGDTVFVHRTSSYLILHDSHSYVIQKNRSHDEGAEAMPPSMLRDFPPPYYAFKPCPGCYVYLVATVPLDTVTLPLQVIGTGLLYWFLSSPQ